MFKGKKQEKETEKLAEIQKISTGFRFFRSLPTMIGVIGSFMWIIQTKKEGKGKREKTP